VFSIVHRAEATWLSECLQSQPTLDHGLSEGASQRWGSHREIVCPTVTLAS
jgi:hypothetical protein